MCEKCGGDIYKIANTFTHHEYFGYNHTNDIGLVKINGTIKFDQKVQPIKLSKKWLDGGNEVVLSSWGSTGKESQEVEENEENQYDEEGIENVEDEENEDDEEDRESVEGEENEEGDEGDEFRMHEPRSLRFVHLTTMDVWTCQKWSIHYRPTVFDWNICTETEKGKGACNGDYGAPLVYNNELVGLLSWLDFSCSSGNPNVFTRVSYYDHWIEKIIEENL